MEANIKQHTEVLKTGIKHAKDNNVFSDVTLVCDDGDLYHAHKLVLISGSPFLKYLLSSQPCQDQAMIFLAGFTNKAIKSLLEFIYAGVLEVEKELLNDVIDTAKDLGIDSLDKVIYNIKLHNESIGNSHKIREIQTEDKTLSHNEDIQRTPTNTNKKSQVHGKATRKLNNALNEENGLFEETEMLFKLMCGACGFKSNLRDVFEQHFDKFHQKGRSLFSCGSCDFCSKEKKILKYHIKQKHTNSSIICGKCDFKAATKTIVKYHFNKNHMGLIYGCDLCPYRAYYKGSITTHTKTVHSKDKSFQCDQCSFVGPQYYLRDHKRVVHRGNECNSCDYKGITKTDLNKHKEQHTLREKLNLTPEQFDKFLATVEGIH